MAFLFCPVGRLIIKDAIMLGATVTTLADSAMSNEELEFSSIIFRQGYIKSNVRPDVVEHIAK